MSADIARCERFTTSAATMECRSGVAACWNLELDAPTTWLYPAWRIFHCRAMFLAELGDTGPCHIVDPPVEVSAEGQIHQRHDPGIGYTIKHDLVQKLTVRSQMF